jgi:WD40 repeat protein
VSVDCVALHPGGRLLAVASSDAAGETATLSMWDLTTPAAPARLSTIEPDGYGRIDGMAFSSDGRTLVAGDDDASADASGLWDVTDPRRVRPLGAFTGDSENGAGSGVFSPDGRVVFTTGGQSGTVRVWNVADPAKPALLDAFTEHTAQSSLYVEVNGLAVSPSGRTLAVADPDSTARLWNITDPAHPVLKATLTGHVAAVTSVGFSRDGRLLATTSIDHTFRLWTAAGR